ncbi:hypothetical protein Pcinc_030448 [Petrolisthes cinctipes]|uniref:Cytochrome P450 n=1 Tax=Petrolisthes cinctipes TaxID=88211 RepID=A0AAE1EYT6_PETCI|nr:hypothetical protein Pcinc_030448 [Petrolisthes cinctipes]
MAFDYEAYTKYGASNSYCGYYNLHEPILLVGNPELIKHIMVKDFDHFTDRRTFKLKQGRDRYLHNMLSGKTGHEWKALRSLVSPIFTSGKIKHMYPLVCKNADVLVAHSLRQAAQQPYVDMKVNFGCYSIDTIASCAFGIECNSLGNNNNKTGDSNNSDFAKHADVFFQKGPRKILKFLALSMFPSIITRLFNLTYTGPEVDFFREVIERALVMRREGNKKRGDFLDLILEARGTTKEEQFDNKEVLSDDSIVSQSMLFLVTGYDTTASALSFCSYELAKNPSEQQRLRDELRGLVVKEGDGYDLTYEAIMEAKFLNACMNETLRMYPPLVRTERICTKAYQVPGSNVYLKPGDAVQIPIWCVQQDPEYWPQPHVFKPDRFMPQNKHNIQSFTHLPFGMGPRNCIAMRFALLEAMVALGKLVLSAELSLAPGQETLVLELGPGVIRPKHGVKLVLKPIVKE